jgi:uncharacterized protein YbbK (DUF523 family)
MPAILEDKIRIGISACNFGALVRYNHKGWDRLAPLGREKDAFIWTPVCPEVMAGLGVPRESVRLVSGNGDDFWAGKAKMKNKRGVDVSEQMRAGMLACLDSLRTAGCEAFVFMEGSPTCGVYRTTLKNKRLGKPPGAFGSLLMQEELYLIPALDLESPIKWWDWRRRLQAFAWLKRQPLASKAEIYEVWNRLKFVCQEVDDRAAREIGRQLADMPKRLTREYALAWRRSVLDLLRRPSTLARIHAVMQKHYAHYRNRFHGEDREIKVPRTEQSKHKFVEELWQMEARAFREGYDFAGAPVIYRGHR